MRRREFIHTTASGAVLALAQLRAQKSTTCYMPGDVVDPGTFVLDARQMPVKLAEILKTASKIAVLAFIGGAYLTTTSKHGGIWCEDSLDEFANFKAARNAWKDKGAGFFAVASPPVYSDRYGWEKNVFLDEPEDSPKYRKAVDEFILKTEALRNDGTIPFSALYFDPRFRLLWNREEHQAVPAYGPVYPWQGKFKWHRDGQRYGEPALWFLSPEGKVLREPLYGNSYAAVPPKIAYTYWEIEAAIGEALSSK